MDALQLDFRRLFLENLVFGPSVKFLKNRKSKTSTTFQCNFCVVLKNVRRLKEVFFLKFIHKHLEDAENWVVSELPFKFFYSCNIRFDESYHCESNYSRTVDWQFFGIQCRCT